VSSGAATVLAAFFGTDAISFSFSSDSLPGVTRSYSSFSAAAQEASDSRVYAGIHWRFDVVAGATIGNEVGTYIITHLLLPVSPGGDGDLPDTETSAAALAGPGTAASSAAAGVVSGALPPGASAPTTTGPSQAPPNQLALVVAGLAASPGATAWGLLTVSLPGTVTPVPQPEPAAATVPAQRPMAASLPSYVGQRTKASAVPAEATDQLFAQESWLPDMLSGA
jgi:hypothetical protein